MNEDDRPAKTEAEIDREETIAANREGLTSAERGELKPVEQVFEEMRAKFGVR